jgi:hypothetical protein
MLSMRLVANMGITSKKNYPKNLFQLQTILDKQTKFDGSRIQDEDSLTKPQLFINQLISFSKDKKRGIQLTNEEIKDECYIMVAGVSSR